MNWYNLKEYNKSLMVDNIFKRKVEIQELYDNSKKLTNQYEYICKNIIKDNLYVIVKNRFPYDIEDDIEHYLIWFNPKYYKSWRRTIIYDNKYIENIINNNKLVNKSYIYFINGSNIQSIKNIQHIHIFMKKY